MSGRGAGKANGCVEATVHDVTGRRQTGRGSNRRVGEGEYRLRSEKVMQPCEDGFHSVGMGSTLLR